MTEGRSERTPEPREPTGPDDPGSRRSAADVDAVLGAVQRVGAEVTSLGRALALQPDEVAARLDVDAAVASVGMRVSALGSALDQFRLSLLAALARTADRLDAPPWLPGVQAALADAPEVLTAVARLEPRLDSLAGDVAAADPGSALSRLEEAVDGLAAEVLAAATGAADDGRLDAVAAAVAAADPRDRIAGLERAIATLADEVRPDPSSDRVARQLETIEQAVARVVADPRLDDLTAAVADADPADRLTTIEHAMGRLTDQVTAGAITPEGLDRIAERLDAIEQATSHPVADPRLDILTTAVTAADPTDRLTALQHAIGQLSEQVATAATTPEGLDRIAERLDAIEQATVAEPRLDALTAAITAADPGERLGRLEDTVLGLAEGVRAGTVIADALEQLGGRLTAIATQVDRITPLARAGDQAGSLFEQLDRVSAGLDQVIALLRSSGPRVGGGGEASDDERFDAVVDVLSGVTRRQDEVTAAVAAIVDQARGPRGIDAVLDRMEQRERALAARLDRIDGELRRRVEVGPSGAGEGVLRADDATARNLDALLVRVVEQERTLGGRLDQVGAELRRVTEAAGAAASRTPDPDPAAGAAMDAVLERLQRQEETLGRHLGWVGDRLAEVAAHLVPDEAAAAAAKRRNDERFTAMGAVLDGVARRQGELASALASALAEARRPPEDPSIVRLAAVADDLARLVASTSERLERRLAGIEATLDEAAQRPAPAPPAPASVEAALRLADLRAERTRVQARLQQERLLVEEEWDG